jgi:hypothetical protein
MTVFGIRDTAHLGAYSRGRKGFQNSGLIRLETLRIYSMH